MNNVLTVFVLVFAAGCTNASSPEVGTQKSGLEAATMIAKGGDRRLAEDAVGAIRDVLLPLAELITPNLPEAAALLGGPEPTDVAAMREMAKALLALGSRAVLLKGGHDSGPQSTDYLADAHGLLWLEGARRDTPNTRGTGCTLATLIAVLLAKGQPLRLACIGAKDALGMMLERGAAARWPQGPGPTGLA